MHNLKLIRENINQYKKKFQDRYLKVDFDNLISLDKENRELIQKKEKLEQEKKIISKQKDKKLFEKSKQISKNILSLEESQKKIKKKISEILDFLPNVALRMFLLEKMIMLIRNYQKLATYLILNLLLNLIMKLDKKVD